MSESQKMHVESDTDNNKVRVSMPMGDGHLTATLDPDQAEQYAHAILLAAFTARGRRLNEGHFRRVRDWKLR
jgi:hypothetical protein